MQIVILHKPAWQVVPWMQIVSLHMQACMTSRALNNAVIYPTQAYMTSRDSNKEDCNSSQACMTSPSLHDKLCAQLSDIRSIVFTGARPSLALIKPEHIYTRRWGTIVSGSAWLYQDQHDCIRISMIVSGSERLLYWCHNFTYIASWKIEHQSDR